jgi:hypothetical protein
MRTLPNILVHGVRVISSPGSSSRHTTRALSVSSCNQDGASSPVITRKKFADLPKARILPDGTPALPMEEWHGGLVGTTSRFEPVHSLSGGSAHIPNELLSLVHLIISFFVLANTVPDDSLPANQTIENTVPMKREHRAKSTLSADGLIPSEGNRKLENKVVHLRHTEIAAGA